MFDNCISTFAKILDKYGNIIKNDNKFIITFIKWLNMLPLSIDKAEKFYCYNYLLKILNNNNILKQIWNNNLNQIIKIIAIILSDNDIENDIKQNYKKL